MFDLFESIDLPKFINIKVTPKAKKEYIKKEVLSDGQVLYKVYVTAVAEDGKANQAVINLISQTLKIAKSHLKIVRGVTTREKVIKIEWPQKI